MFRLEFICYLHGKWTQKRNKEKTETNWVEFGCEKGVVIPTEKSWIWNVE